ncbi:MAG: sodium ion-translocating decarboxylase subunit beta [Oscillospiraceae bacterium]|nr:sodium ion-translocating decarboxylase subunit beta [Oscillospiraceae bacterium]
MLEALKGLFGSSAFETFINWFLNEQTDENGKVLMAPGWQYLVMIGIACLLLYLAIVKKFEPLLLMPIAFGMLLVNIPTLTDGIFHMEYFVQGDAAEIQWASLGGHGGLLDYLYLGVKLGIFPPLIFLGVGAMTDFSPLIANPKSLLLGAAAQFGVFAAFVGALLLGFDVVGAASIGIIGGADGPTAIYVTKTLAPALLGAIAIAAYSYMALVPLIQPPIMKALTSKKERMIKMEVLRPVSKTEQILFPIIVAAVVCSILPSALPLVGMLMLGNLLRVSGVTERLSKTAQNELMNIVTIMLGVCVGATADALHFLNLDTLKIILLGLCAFAFATIGGTLFGKVMCLLTGGKINPLIGSAGVSAVPMAARVSQKVGQQENPSNFLLMHAMGPNVAGVIGSAVAAGVFLSLFQ